MHRHIVTGMIALLVFSSAGVASPTPQRAPASTIISCEPKCVYGKQWCQSCDGSTGDCGKQYWQDCDASSLPDVVT
jgi:hypothetical protein